MSSTLTKPGRLQYARLAPPRGNDARRQIRARRQAEIEAQAARGLATTRHVSRAGRANALP
jgi:hypothetical protein